MADDYDDDQSTEAHAAQESVPAAPQPFDISVLATEDTAELVINHPVTGEPTTWVWMIAGPSHPAAIAADDDLAKDNKREALAIKKAQANNRKWNPEVRSTDEEKRRSATHFGAKVLGWSEVVINGDKFPHSRTNVVTILLNPSYWLVYKQLIDFINDEKSFMKPSAKN